MDTWQERDPVEKRVTRTILYHWGWLDWANREIAQLSPKELALPYSRRPFGSNDIHSVCKHLVQVVEINKKFDPDDLDSNLSFVYQDIFGNGDCESHHNLYQFLRDVIRLRLGDLKMARMAFSQMGDQERLNDVEQGIILFHSWLGLTIGQG